MKTWHKIGIVVAVLFVIGGINNAINPPHNNIQPDTQSSTSLPDAEPIIKTEPQSLGASTETKTVTETQAVPFDSTTQNDATLASGTSVVVVAGVNGERTIKYEVTYQNGSETGRKEVSNTITKQPVTQVTKLGTKVAYVAPKPVASNNCDPNYTPCIPYVAGNTLNCPDIGVMVHVVGTDHNKFDADHDGYGCESYR